MQRESRPAARCHRLLFRRHVVIIPILSPLALLRSAALSAATQANPNPNPKIKLRVGRDNEREEHEFAAHTEIAVDEDAFQSEACRFETFVERLARCTTLNALVVFVDDAQCATLLRAMSATRSVTQLSVHVAALAGATSDAVRAFACALPPSLARLDIVSNSCAEPSGLLRAAD